MDIFDLHWMRALATMTFVFLVCLGFFRFIKWQIEKREEEEKNEEDFGEDCS